MITLGGIVLGLINIALVVAIFVLIGYVVLWFMGRIGWPVPDNVQKIYMVIVALIALYMLAALLLGMPSWRLVGSQVPAVRGTIAEPPSIIVNK